jgi:O-antigen ligase
MSPDATPGAVSSPSHWELTLLLSAAAFVALPDLFDLDAFKLATLSLLAAVVLLPRLLLAGRDDLRAWLTCPAGWLYLGSIAWALAGSLSVLAHADVADRILGALLATLAATLGLRAARGDRRALGATLTLLTIVTAMVALLQAVGVETRFTAGEPDVVALMGNSTRAGALLALGLPIALLVLVSPEEQGGHHRVRLAASALALGTAALILTRARGAWLAAAVGMAAVALLCMPSLRRHLRVWLVPMLVGIGLAVVLAGGFDVLTGAKLPGSANPLTGEDLTTQVRLSVYRGTLDMIASEPLTGSGLGRFRESFPPFRDPAEASLPGLAGATTEVDHPHNEPLLAFAEGGLPGGLMLLAFVLLTVGRALRRARAGDAGDRAALVVLLSGCVVGLVQNAWISSGTALPFFAAAGWVWASRGSRGASRGGRVLLPATILASMAVLFVLAIPRVRSQWLLREFYLLQSAAAGIDATSFDMLVTAADADPGDVNAQRMLHDIGRQVLALGVSWAARAEAPVQRASERLAVLSPHTN